MRSDDAERLALLRTAATEWQGEWTTRRAQHLYQARFGSGDWRRTARRDLAELTAQGLLTQRGPENQRTYTFNAWGQQ